MLGILVLQSNPKVTCLDLHVLPANTYSGTNSAGTKTCAGLLSLDLLIALVSIGKFEPGDVRDVRV